MRVEKKVLKVTRKDLEDIHRYTVELQMSREEAVTKKLKESEIDRRMFHAAEYTGGAMTVEQQSFFRAIKFYCHIK